MNGTQLSFGLFGLSYIQKNSVEYVPRCFLDSPKGVFRYKIKIFLDSYGIHLSGRPFCVAEGEGKQKARFGSSLRLRVLYAVERRHAPCEVSIILSKHGTIRAK